MKILILYRHFWPDSPPYASMLRSIGRALVDAGHDVTVWTEEPCYKTSDRSHAAPRREILDGIIVERFARLPDHVVTEPMRLLDKLLFVPRLLLKAIIRRVRGGQYDLIWTATIPPVLQGWAGRTIATIFDARFLYHCQDLYPELAGHMGLWRKGGWLYRTMEHIERRTRERADLLVTLSGDMAITACALGEPRKLAVINNFPLEDFSASRPESAPPVPVRRDGGKVQIIFAGNIGSFQGLESVIEAMRSIEPDCPAFELVLMGEGKALPDLKRRAADLSNVRFEPHRPYEEARAWIAGADLGVVALEPEIYRYAFPSKTLTYLRLGVPILALVEEGSDLASMVLERKIGLVARPRDIQAIEAQLRAINDSPGRLRDMKQYTQEYKDTLSIEKNLAKWVFLLDGS